MDSPCWITLTSASDGPTRVRAERVFAASTCFSGLTEIIGNAGGVVFVKESPEEVVRMIEEATTNKPKFCSRCGVFMEG
jgi:hypothetical protein